jgi:tagatose kinase
MAQACEPILYAASLGELVVEMFRPEPDQPFDQTGVFLGPYASGAPAIFIDSLAKLGCRCSYYATVGDDAFGDFLIRRLQADGVETLGVYRLEGFTTGVAFTMFRHDGSRSFIYHSQRAAPGQFGPQHLERETLQKVRFLHISANVLAFSLSARAACYQAVDLVRAAGGTISFDPNIRPEMMSREAIWGLCGPVVQAAQVVMPSGAEARMLTGAADDAAACRQLLALGVPCVVMKEGRQGSTVLTRDGSIHAPAYEVTELDPTGAGDCFDAGFVYGLAHGWPLARCAQFANALGAMTVRVRGAMEGFSNLQQVEAFMVNTPLVAS